MSNISQTIDDLINEVANREKCSPDDVQWYSWPQNFPTTSGPKGGAGGCMITSFQVFAFDPPTGNRQKYCGGVWRRWKGEFNDRW